MGRVGWPELIIILVVILVLFGASRLPGIARALGSSAREFKEGLEDSTEEDDETSPKS